MSHTTTIKSVKITDINALRAAVADLQAQGVKCSLKENVRPRMYYGNQHGVCPFVLHLEGSRYDVGFDKQKDGSYVPVFDEWQGHVGGQIGATCPMPNSPEGRAQHAIGRMLQGYAKHAAMNAALAQGYMVESCETDEKGNVNLVLAGM